MSANLITVAQFLNLPMAEVCRSRLEAAGVHTYLSDPYPGFSNEAGVFGLGKNGLEVQVEDTDLERAREVLDEDPLSPEEEAATAKKAAAKKKKKLERLAKQKAKKEALRTEAEAKATADQSSNLTDGWIDADSTLRSELRK